MPWPDMPKHLGKDAFLQQLEARYATKGTAAEALAKLRSKLATGANMPLVNVGMVDDVYKQRNDLRAKYGTVQPVKEHFTNDWFDPNTYWWINWDGDPEGTMRELLIRALEVSLGVSHDNTTDKDTIERTAPRHWPIEFFWICGLPRFEGYVSWKTGQVTVILLTPGFVGHDQPAAGGSPWRFPVQDFPDESAAVDGWVVGDAGANIMPKPEGIMFVGQNLESNSGPHVVMRPGVVVNHLFANRGGVG